MGIFSGDIAVHTGEYCGSCDSVQEEIFLMRETGCGEMLTVADFPDSKGEL